jgi:hypothetical protein
MTTTTAPALLETPADPNPARLMAARPAQRLVAMGRLLRLENLALLAAAGLLYAHLGFSGWTFAALFLLPDVAIAGWLFSPRVGALAYNAAHSLVGPAILASLGTLPGHPHAFKLALIWVAHIAFDRALGYGLKYGSSFKDTHLGRV